MRNIKKTDDARPYVLNESLDNIDLSECPNPTKGDMVIQDSDTGELWMIPGNVFIKQGIELLNSICLCRPIW